MYKLQAPGKSTKLCYKNKTLKQVAEQLQKSRTQDYILRKISLYMATGDRASFKKSLYEYIHSEGEEKKATKLSDLEYEFRSKQLWKSYTPMRVAILTGDIDIINELIIFEFQFNQADLDYARTTYKKEHQQNPESSEIIQLIERNVNLKKSINIIDLTHVQLMSYIILPFVNVVSDLPKFIDTIKTQLVPSYSNNILNPGVFSIFALRILRDTGYINEKVRKHVYDNLRFLKFKIQKLEGIKVFEKEVTGAYIDLIIARIYSDELKQDTKTPDKSTQYKNAIDTIKALKNKYNNPQHKLIIIELFQIATTFLSADFNEIDGFWKNYYDIMFPELLFLLKNAKNTQELINVVEIIKLSIDNFIEDVLDKLRFNSNSQDILDKLFASIDGVFNELISKNFGGAATSIAFQFANLTNDFLCKERCSKQNLKNIKKVLAKLYSFVNFLFNNQQIFSVQHQIGIDTDKLKHLRKSMRLSLGFSDDYHDVYEAIQNANYTALMNLHMEQTLLLERKIDDKTLFEHAIDKQDPVVLEVLFIYMHLKFLVCGEVSKILKSRKLNKGSLTKLNSMQQISQKSQDLKGELKRVEALLKKKYLADADADEFRRLINLIVDDMYVSIGSNGRIAIGHYAILDMVLKKELSADEYQKNIVFSINRFLELIDSDELSPKQKLQLYLELINLTVIYHLKYEPFDDITRKCCEVLEQAKQSLSSREFCVYNACMHTNILSNRLCFFYMRESNDLSINNVVESIKALFDVYQDNVEVESLVVYFFNRIITQINIIYDDIVRDEVGHEKKSALARTLLALYNELFEEVDNSLWRKCLQNSAQTLASLILANIELNDMKEEERGLLKSIHTFLIIFLTRDIKTYEQRHTVKSNKTVISSKSTVVSSSTTTSTSVTSTSDSNDDSSNEDNDESDDGAKQPESEEGNEKHSSYEHAASKLSPPKKKPNSPPRPSAMHAQSSNKKEKKKQTHNSSADTRASTSRKRSPPKHHQNGRSCQPVDKTPSPTTAQQHPRTWEGEDNKNSFFTRSPSYYLTLDTQPSSSMVVEDKYLISNPFNLPNIFRK